MQNQDKQISVIMPALNEEKNIIPAIDSVVTAFGKYNLRGEIIVINDGSADSTSDLVKSKVSQAGSCEIRLIDHDKPQGVGASFWEGAGMAKSDAVVMLPGDNENDPGEIFRYYKLLEDVDIVIPFVYNKQARNILRNLLSSVYIFIINFTFSINLHYANGTVLYRRSILKDLKSRESGFFFQTDILVKLIKNGYLFSEVPYKLIGRKKGISKALKPSSLICVAGGYFRLIKDCLITGYAKLGDFAPDSRTAHRRLPDKGGQG